MYSNPFAEIQARWDAISCDPLPHLWTDPVFSECASLADVRQLTWEPGAVQPLFAALIELAQAGDETATLTILNALVPKLRLTAQKLSHIPTASEDLLSTLYVAIATYDLDSRTGSIPGSLALQARRDTERLSQRQSPARELATAGVDDLADDLFQEQQQTPDVAALAAALLEQAIATHTVLASEAVVLQAVYLDGMSGREASSASGICAASVRSKCRSGVEKMRLMAA